MGERRLKDQYKRLLNFFRPAPQPSDEFYVAWEKCMRQYESDIVDKMIDHIQTHETRLPALNNMYLIADSIAINEREEKTKRERAENVKHIMFHKCEDDYGKKCIDIITNHLLDKSSRKEFLDAMRELGMVSEAAELENYYRKNSYHVECKPRHEILEKKLPDSLTLNHTEFEDPKIRSMLMHLLNKKTRKNLESINHTNPIKGQDY